MNMYVAQSIKNNILASTHHVQAIGWAKKNWTVIHSNYGCDNFAMVNRRKHVICQKFLNLV